MAELKDLGPKDLKLDLENPRFGLAEAEDQDEAISFLVQRADIRELWESIAERGYEPYEPLVAYYDQVLSRYVVIEGNRRLAAVLTLLDPDLVKVRSPSPPEITDDIRQTMKELPVYIVDRREDADDYIGFKHINGPTTWGALAKAKFAVKLFEKLPAAQDGADTRVSQLSRRLGDGRQLILRSLVAYKIIQQAVDEEFIPESRVEEGELDFSHLYTILQNRDARTYLGIGTAPLSERLVVNHPVPSSHELNLKNMMAWLFGTAEQPSIIKSQGTDRPKLQKVLSSPDALAQLEVTGDFEAAVSLAGFDTDNWVAMCIRLEALARKVSTGINDLPPELPNEDVQNSLKKLDAAIRHITLAKSGLAAVFS